MSDSGKNLFGDGQWFVDFIAPSPKIGEVSPNESYSPLPNKNSEYTTLILCVVLYNFIASFITFIYDTISMHSEINVP